MLESSDAFTPGPAVGLPLVLSGGQIEAHSVMPTQVSRLRGSR